MAQMCPTKSTIVPFKKQIYSSGSNLCYTNFHQTLNEAHRRENVQYIGGIGFSKILLFFNASFANGNPLGATALRKYHTFSSNRT